MDVMPRLRTILGKNRAVSIILKMSINFIVKIKRALKKMQGIHLSKGILTTLEIIFK